MAINLRARIRCDLVALRSFTSTFPGEIISAWLPSFSPPTSFVLVLFPVRTFLEWATAPSFGSCPPHFCLSAREALFHRRFFSKISRHVDTRVSRSGRRNSGTVSCTLDMDVATWPARFSPGFVKCFAVIFVYVFRSLKFRPRPPHSFRLVPREEFEY